MMPFLRLHIAGQFLRSGNEDELRAALEADAPIRDRADHVEAPRDRLADLQRLAAN